VLRRTKLYLWLDGSRPLAAGMPTPRRARDGIDNLLYWQWFSRPPQDIHTLCEYLFFCFVLLTKRNYRQPRQKIEKIALYK
jgi:hypothetical protein